MTHEVFFNKLDNNIKEFTSKYDELIQNIKTLREKYELQQTNLNSLKEINTLFNSYLGKIVNVGQPISGGTLQEQITKNINNINYKLVRKKNNYNKVELALVNLINEIKNTISKTNNIVQENITLQNKIKTIIDEDQIASDKSNIYNDLVDSYQKIIANTNIPKIYTKTISLKKIEQKKLAQSKSFDSRGFAQSKNIKKLTEILSNTTIKVNRSLTGCDPGQPQFQFDNKDIRIADLNKMGITIIGGMWQSTTINCGKTKGSVATGLQCCYNYWIDILYKKEEYHAIYIPARSTNDLNGLGIIFLNVKLGYINENDKNLILQAKPHELFNSSQIILPKQFVLDYIETDNDKNNLNHLFSNIKNLIVIQSSYKTCLPSYINYIRFIDSDMSMQDIIPYFNAYGVMFLKYYYVSKNCVDDTTQCCYDFLFIISYKNKLYSVLYLSKGKTINFESITEGNDINNFKQFGFKENSDVSITIEQDKFPLKIHEGGSASGDSGYNDSGCSSYSYYNKYKFNKAQYLKLKDALTFQESL